MTPNFPLTGLGMNDGIPSLLPASSTSSLSSPTTSSALSSAKGILSQIGNGAAGVGNNILSALFGGASGYQYLTGVVGLILIIIGLFLFRPVKDTIVNVSKTVGKAAAEGAIAA